MVERWSDGDYTLDEWDEEHGRDDELTDYVKTDTRDETVRDAYEPTAEALTDGGEAVSRGAGDGNGEHWKNEGALDEGMDHAPARTIVTGFGENSRKWRLHEDLKVSVQDDEVSDSDADDGGWYTAPHTDPDERAEKLLLDGKLQTTGLSSEAHDAVFKLVSSEQKTVQWNLHHGGHEGMIVGYAAWWLNPRSLDDAQAYAEAVGPKLGLDEEEARAAAAYAFERAEERYGSF